jgi:hypothetical protein
MDLYVQPSKILLFFPLCVTFNGSLNLKKAYAFQGFIKFPDLKTIFMGPKIV